MIARITPAPLSGTVPAIASKSVAHRLIIAAALADRPTHVLCNTTCDDIEATAGCLEALGARVEAVADGFMVTPVAAESDRPHAPTLDCKESGSTFRFMLPVACALESEAIFTGAERLGQRPITALTDELFAAGCDFDGIGGFPLRTHGRMRPGRFQLPGDVSSQFISGIMLAAPIFGHLTEILVTGRIESKPYVNLTIQALKSFGVRIETERIALADGAQGTLFTVPDVVYRSPGTVQVEGDWSNAAFWLCAGAMGSSPVCVDGLSLTSAQGDRNILAALSRFGAGVRRSTDAATIQPDKLVGFEMSAQDIPDLVPIVAAVAALADGTTIIRDCKRLRMKESDRVATVTETLSRLGADISIDEDSIVMRGKPQLEGGEVDAHNDHRIAMMAAIAATRCAGEVTIHGAEAVNKSYPLFFTHYRQLGGQVSFEEGRSWHQSTATCCI